jgi:hypothetical protein
MRSYFGDTTLARRRDVPPGVNITVGKNHSFRCCSKNRWVRDPALCYKSRSMQSGFEQKLAVRLLR